MGQVDVEEKLKENFEKAKKISTDPIKITWHNLNYTVKVKASSNDPKGEKLERK